MPWASPEGIIAFPRSSAFRPSGAVCPGALGVPPDQLDGPPDGRQDTVQGLVFRLGVRVLKGDRFPVAGGREPGQALLQVAVPRFGRPVVAAVTAQAVQVDMPDPGQEFFRWERVKGQPEWESRR